MGVHCGALQPAWIGARPSRLSDALCTMIWFGIVQRPMRTVIKHVGSEPGEDVAKDIIAVSVGWNFSEHVSQARGSWQVSKQRCAAKGEIPKFEAHNPEAFPRKPREFASCEWVGRHVLVCGVLLFTLVRWSLTPCRVP